MSSSGAASSGLATPGAEGYQDLLGWNYDYFMRSTAHVLAAAATLYLCRVPLPAALSVTDVVVDYTNAGSVLTNSFVALYTSAGTLVGQSADQSTVWATVGDEAPLKIALASGPFTVSPLAANDFVWAAFYVGTASSLPGFGSIGANEVAVGTTAARARWGSYAVANTSTLPNITPASITQPSTESYWAGLS